MKVFIFILLALQLQSCITSTITISPEFQVYFNRGLFSEASDLAYASLEDVNYNKRSKTNNFLLELNGATAAIYAENYSLSNKLFNKAIDSLNTKQTAGYSPKYYEKIMLNTYNGLVLLQSHKPQEAKIEFNRATFQQAKALEENKNKIIQQQEKYAKKGYDDNISLAVTALHDKYKEFNNFVPYSDFANPYTSYINGLFKTIYGSKSDIENGILDLKRAQDMTPDNSFITLDINTANNIANNQKVPPTVWIIYEDGLIAKIDKVAFNIPLILKDHVNFVTISLPKIAPIEGVYQNIQISTNKEKVVTQTIVDMDRIIKTELQNKFSLEIAKAVAWAIASLLSQEATNNSLTWLGNLAISKILTNPVETRTWSTLPKYIQIARLEIPENRKLQILNSNGQIISDKIILEKDAQFVLINVRIPTREAEPSIIITKLK